jgi:hypothetical protein
MHDLGLIRDRIIKKAFPELMDEDIQVEYAKLEDALLEYASLTGEGFYIEVDESLKKAPIEVLEGGFAHELSHILVDKTAGITATIRDRLAYSISERYKTLDERNTDVNVVIRGYGSQLLAFLEYAEKEGFPHYKEDGLSILEVRAILSSGRD